MAELVLSNLSKTFGGPLVIDALDLAVGSGEFIALVGPSGCGKSVLLRMIAGLEKVTQGRVVLGGQDVTGMAPHDRNIAMVFQNYALYPHLTVAGNLGIGLRQAGMSRTDTRTTVKTAADALSLTPLLDRLPQDLSGGERQRVAIGRAIVRKPDLFLFDEPLSNLDAALRVHMRIELSQLHRTLGTTTIYVTHDQVEAMTLADRIVVMHDGKVEQVGRPMDVYHDPDTRFVAGFIGSPQMNFLTVAAQTGRIHTLGVRPEHISVNRSGGAVAGHVDHIETLGSETNLIVRTGAYGMVTVRLFGHQPFGLSEAVFLDFNPQRQLWFDAKGCRIRNP